VAIRLGPEQRAALEARVGAPPPPQCDASRPWLVPLAAEGHKGRAIGRLLKTMPGTVAAAGGASSWPS
jgi:hypothetical protein